MSIRIATTGVIIAVASVVPLLLYIAIGPADGHPVGLGLLMVLAVAGLVALVRRLAG